MYKYRAYSTAKKQVVAATRFFAVFILSFNIKGNGNGYHVSPRFFQYVFVYFYFRLLPKTYPRGKPISIRRHLYAFISNW